MLPSTPHKPGSGSFSRYRLLVPAALIGLWFLFLRNALDGSTSFALFMDNEFFLGPVLSSMSASIRAGEWPLRMDTILGGLPLYNFTQLTPYYPLYLLPLPLYESIQQSIHSMHMVTVIHLLIMEINTYVFLRVLGASRLAALTGAALITFSANSFNYAAWMNIVAPYAWFPLFLAGIVGLAQGRPRRPYALITMAGIVMLTLASPAQPLIHALFMAGIFCLFHYRHELANDAGSAWLKQFFWPLCALGLFCFFVVAPALLPPVADLDEMVRWVGDFPPVYGNDRIPFAAYEVEQLAPADLGGVLFKFGDMAVGHQFTGLVVVGLALITVFSPRRAWTTNALVFIAVYSLLSSFGSNLGLGYLNYWIPLLNKIREPSRFLFLFQFATCALAALALDELRRSADQHASRLMQRQWLAMAALLGVGAITWLLLQERMFAAMSRGLSVFILLLLVAFSWLMPRLAFAGKGLVLASAWSLAALAILAMEVTWQPPQAASSQYETEHLPLLDAALQRVAELDPTHAYRVIFDGSIDRQKAAMIASYRGIQTLNAYFNPAPREQFEELYYSDARTDNYARVLGAKFLLCKDCPAGATRGYHYSETIAGHELYTTMDVLPHSYVATAVSGEFSRLGEFIEKAAGLPLDSRFLFMEASETPALLLPDSGKPASICSSHEELRSTNRVDVRVECGVPGVLVLNKFHDGHWRVRVDGEDTVLLRVNGNQMGVRIPEGSHAVEFRYRPLVVTLTVTLPVLALLLTVYLAWRGRLASLLRQPERRTIPAREHDDARQRAGTIMQQRVDATMQQFPSMLERLLPFLLAGSVAVILIAVGWYTDDFPLYWEGEIRRDALTWIAACAVLAALLRYSTPAQALPLFIGALLTYLIGGVGLVETASAALFFVASYLYGRILLWLLFSGAGESTAGFTRPLLIGIAMQLSFFGVLIHVPLNTRVTHALVQGAPILLLCLSGQLPALWRQGSAALSAGAQVLARMPYWYCVTLIILLGAVARYAFFPSLTFDDNAAHLRMWTELAANRQFSFDVITQVWELTPFAVNLMHAIISLVAGVDGRGAMNLFLLALLCRQLWVVLAHVGLGAVECLLLLVLFVSTPLTGILLVSLQAELFMALLATVGIRLVLQSPREWYNGNTVALLAIVALCCAVKLPGIVLGALLALVALAQLWPLRVHELGRHSAYSRFFLACTLLGFAALALNPYVYAWFTTGNPVFPLYNAIFKSPFYEAVNFRDYNWTQVFSLGSWWNMFFNTPRFYESFNFVAGFQYLFLLPLALLVSLRRLPPKPALVLLVPLLGFGLLMFAMSRYLRYLYPVFPLAVAVIGLLLIRNTAAVSSRSPATARAAIISCIILNFWFYPGTSWIFMLASTSPGLAYTPDERDTMENRLMPAKDLTALVNDIAPGSQVLYHPDSPFGATLVGDPVYLTWYSPSRVARAATINDEAGVKAFLNAEGIDFVIWNMDSLHPPGSAQWLLKDYLSRHGRPVGQSTSHTLYKLQGLPLVYQEIFQAGNLAATASPLLAGSIATQGAGIARFQISFRCDAAAGFLVAEIAWDSGDSYRRQVPCRTETLEFAEALVIPAGAIHADLSLSTEGGAAASITTLTLETN